MKAVVKAVMARTPYRIVRSAQNRFDAFEHCLSHLRDLGLDPTVIIDGGAHLGSFAKMAARIFPGAEIHLIEPQAACAPALARLAAERGFAFHQAALGDATDVATGLVLAAGETPSTGAHISPERQGEAVRVEELDRLVPSRDDARALLKLDLQGFELHALRGAREMLKRTHVVLTEVSLFRQAYEPTVLELLAFLDAAGFELFDIAALSGRTRDGRLRQGDFVFARRGTMLTDDTRWA